MSIDHSIIESIINNTLTKLSVKSKTLENLTELAKAIRKNTSLKIIEFSDCKIKKIKPLAKALITNKSIEVLDFQRDIFDDIDELFKSLIQLKETSKIRSLVIHCGVFYCSSDFCNFIKSNKIIKSLDLSGNAMLNVPEFYEALKVSSFKELSLCCFNNDNFNYISEMLKVNKSIEKLDLKDNIFVDISSLNEVLPINKTLKVLDLTQNAIKNLNVSLEALQQNNTLESIILFKNQINTVNNSLINLIDSKNINLNINNNPINKMFEYFIISIKSFGNDDEYHRYYDKFCCYGADVKSILKNNELYDKNIDYILKYNKETKIIDCYKFNDDLTYSLSEYDFNKINKINLENDTNKIDIGIETLHPPSPFDIGFKKYLNNLFNNKVRAIAYQISNFCDKDILKSNYKLKK